MQKHQHGIAALDAKYTQDLADVQAHINLPEHDAAVGKRRLLFNAQSGKNSTASATSLDDTISLRLTDAAESGCKSRIMACNSLCAKACSLCE